MTIRYEANPPRIDPPGNIDAFLYKLERISTVCNGIHITENVLSIPRVSPLKVGRSIHSRIPDCSLTVSMRVRDKTAPQIDIFANDAISAGFEGLLAVAGDRSPGSRDSGQIPSKVVSRLRQNREYDKLDLYLSVPAGPAFGPIRAKIQAKPRGFMTQVIQTAEQVENIVALLPGFDIIPIILFCSPKNRKAAEFLGIDMFGYGDMAQFVSRIHRITGDVLITSPGDYDGVYGFLSQNTL